MVGRICGAGKNFSLELNTEGGKADESDNGDENYHRHKSDVTESHEEVQEVDSRLQRQGDTRRKQRICDFQRGV